MRFSFISYLFTFLNFDALVLNVTRIDPFVNKWVVIVTLLHDLLKTIYILFVLLNLFREQLMFTIPSSDPTFQSMNQTLIVT